MSALLGLALVALGGGIIAVSLRREVTLLPGIIGCVVGGVCIWCGAALVV